MKTILKTLFLCGGISFTAVCFVQTGTAAQPSQKTNSTAVKTNIVAEIPKSIFDDKDGKDPFFPRRSKTIPGEPTKKTANVSDFVLKGITIGEKRTCIINGYTLAQGEAQEIKTPSGVRSKIHVQEIKEDSVIITVDDAPAPVELRMRPGQF